MNVNVGSPCDNIGSQLPLCGSPHDIDGSHQRNELKECDYAGDHGDFVAQAPSSKPFSENVTAHPATITEFSSRNMGLSRALSRSCGLPYAKHSALMC